VVAFSGGVDSTLLLSIAKEVLGERVIAVTVASPLQPEAETADASRIARHLRSKHIVHHINVLTERNIKKNSLHRCYYCKMVLMKKIKALAEKKGYVAIEASNVSDLKDHRPGLEAVRRLEIESPLITAGLKKEDIRRAARTRRLPNWNKPSTACLASRIPYGVMINLKTLRRVEKAEEYIRRLGFSQIRVRDHLPIARIEVDPHEFRKLLTHRLKIVRYLRRLGYNHVVLDLRGYRTGSLNP
jgi:uncharacterized protein